MADNPENKVDEYIEKCPKKAQVKLLQLRKTIKETAPGAVERTDYFDMPGYSYEGYDYSGMFVWFSYKEPYIRIHVRPPAIDDYKVELKDYPTTKAIASFPADRELPMTLIKKLVVASLKIMKDK